MDGLDGQRQKPGILGPAVDTGGFYKRCLSVGVGIKKDGLSSWASPGIDDRQDNDAGQQRRQTVWPCKRQEALARVDARAAVSRR